MKKFLSTLLVFLVACFTVLAEENSYDAIYDGYQVLYSITDNTWSTGGIADSEIVLTKKLYDGAGSYSQYINSEGKIAFTLTSNFEFIKDGMLIAINNDELKYNKILYDGENFEEIPLSYDELQSLFPNAEILRLSLVDDDYKMWIHKPLTQEKVFLFVNDSDKYFHKLTANCKKAHDKDIRGLITISRYGIYRFKHYGQRDGKLTLYVR